MGEDVLTREELLELRGAMLYLANLRLQHEIGQRDLRELQAKLTEKYGADAVINPDTGAISRQVGKKLREVP